MNLYSLELKEDWMERIEVGDSIYIKDDYVKIISIIKVDFSERTIWFTGILEDDLNRTRLKHNE